MADSMQILLTSCFAWVAKASASFARNRQAQQNMRSHGQPSRSGERKTSLSCSPLYAPALSLPPTACCVSLTLTFMSVVPLTLTVSLCLVFTFVLFFLREYSRRRFSSAESEALLPLADETPRLAGLVAVSGATTDAVHGEHGHGAAHACHGNGGCASCKRRAARSSALPATGLHSPTL